MRTTILALAVLLLLGACRVVLDGTAQSTNEFPSHVGIDAPGEAPDATERPTPTLGVGASPGNKRGPGGFEPRGTRKNFYAGAGGRLWYYTNNYYWVSKDTPTEDLWIKAVVVEEFQDLQRWPNGESVDGPEPKRTVEYWEVGAGGRSVRLDNHKDYCLLSAQYSAGAIVVEVTLTLGRLEVRDEKGAWDDPDDAYVLESRNYSDGGGVGSERTSFRVDPREAETVWSYRIPWSLHPQRLTRSKWVGLELPEWTLDERRPPPAGPAPVVTPTSTEDAAN